MYVVYVLRSLKDKNLYIGQTSDLEKRIREHNEGKVVSTCFRRPFVLVGNKLFKSHREARWFEYNLKKHGDKKRKFIKELEAFA